MEFPVSPGLATTCVESTETFHLWISPGFEKSIAYCLIKKHCLQARKEVQGIKLLKALCQLPEIVSINLWVTGEAGRRQPGIKCTEHYQSASLLWAHTFPVHYTQESQGRLLTLMFFSLATGVTSSSLWVTLTTMFPMMSTFLVPAAGCTFLLMLLCAHSQCMPKWNLLGTKFASLVST